MPWMIQDNCVHKKNADGSAGDLVKCHDDAESAKKHLAALYASEGDKDDMHEMVSFTDTVISEFDTTHEPDVPLAPGIDLAELTQGDDAPFFLTLPLPAEGTVSKNGLLYDAELLTRITEQLLDKRPGGIRGHIPADQKSTAFPVSQVHWVGAHKAGTQTWMKGYIPRTFPDIREDYRIERAKRGKAATSIYGNAVREFQGDDHTVWRAKNFDLSQIDLAPHSRAAAPGAGVFYITSEMASESTDTADVKDQDMPDKKELLAELTAEDIQTLPVFQTVRESIIATYQAETEGEQRVAELQADNDAKAARITELEAQQNAQALLIAEYQTKQFTADFDTKIAELTDWKLANEADEGAQEALNSLRSVIKDLALAKLGDVREMEQAATTLEGLISGELKALVEMTRDRLAGPPVVVPGKDNRSNGASGPIVVEDTPETRQKAADVWAFKKG